LTSTNNFLFNVCYSVIVLWVDTGCHSIRHWCWSTSGPAYSCWPGKVYFWPGQMPFGTTTELFGGFPGSVGRLQETWNLTSCGAMHESADPA